MLNYIIIFFYFGFCVHQFYYISSMTDFIHNSTYFNELNWISYYRRSKSIIKTGLWPTFSIHYVLYMIIAWKIRIPNWPGNSMKIINMVVWCMRSDFILLENWVAEDMGKQMCLENLWVLYEQICFFKKYLFSYEDARIPDFDIFWSNCCLTF